MTAPDLKRVEELGQYLESWRDWLLGEHLWDENDSAARCDLLAILDAYVAQLKAGATTPVLDKDGLIECPFCGKRYYMTEEREYRVGGDDEK